MIGAAAGVVATLIAVVVDLEQSGSFGRKHH